MQKTQTYSRCHTPSGFIAYSRPPRVGLFAVPHPPNVQQGVVFLPTQTPVAEQQWEEHTDEKTKKKYWHNKVTKKVRPALFDAQGWATTNSSSSSYCCRVFRCVS